MVSQHLHRSYRRHRVDDIHQQWWPFHWQYLVRGGVGKVGDFSWSYPYPSSHENYSRRGVRVKKHEIYPSPWMMISSLISDSQSFMLQWYHRRWAKDRRQQLDSHALLEEEATALIVFLSLKIGWRNDTDKCIRFYGFSSVSSSPTNPSCWRSTNSLYSFEEV